jgi:hypothetical protein
MTYHGSLDYCEWNGARITMLCERLGEGSSFAVVASALGVTRGVISGKFDRLKSEFAGRMSKAGFCERLSEGAELEDIAEEAGVSFGAAEAMLAQVRRDLGPQAR